MVAVIMGGSSQAVYAVLKELWWDGCLGFNSERLVLHISVITCGFDAIKDGFISHIITVNNDLYFTVLEPPELIFDMRSLQVTLHIFQFVTKPLLFSSPPLHFRITSSHKGLVTAPTFTT
jgi:hypothetical protein